MYVCGLEIFVTSRFQVVEVPNPLLFAYECDVSCTEYVSTFLENEAKTSV